MVKQCAIERYVELLEILDEDIKKTNHTRMADAERLQQRIASTVPQSMRDEVLKELEAQVKRKAASVAVKRRCESSGRQVYKEGWEKVSVNFEKSIPLPFYFRDSFGSPDVKHVPTELRQTILMEILKGMHGYRFINKLGDCKWTVKLNHPDMIQNCDVSYPSKSSPEPVHLIGEFHGVAYALESKIRERQAESSYSTEVRKAFFDMTLAFKNVDNVDSFLRERTRAECINNFCAPIKSSTASSAEHGMPDLAMVDAFNRIHCAQSNLNDFVFKMSGAWSTFLGLLRFDGNMLYIYIDCESFHHNSLRPGPTEGFKLSVDGVAQAAEFDNYTEQMKERDNKAGIKRRTVGKIGNLTWRKEWSPDDNTPNPSSEAQAIRKEVYRIISTPTSAVQVWIRNMETFPANTDFGGSEYYIRRENASVSGAEEEFERVYGSH